MIQGIEKDLDEPTLMGSLAQRRKELAKELVLPLRVPRWEDPKIVVSYRPLDPEEVEKAYEKVADAKNRSKARTDAEARLLATAVLSIEITWAKQTEINQNRKFSNFGPDLGAELEVEDKSAVAIVRALFLTEADIYAHGRELALWSGSANKNLVEKFRGE